MFLDFICPLGMWCLPVRMISVSLLFEVCTLSGGGAFVSACSISFVSVCPVCFVVVGESSLFLFQSEVLGEIDCDDDGWMI